MELSTLELDLDFYRSLIEAMEEGVFVLDDRERMVTFNASLLKILNQTEEEAMAGEVSAIYEDGLPVPRNDLPAYVTLRTGIPLSGVILGITRKGLGVAWVSVNTRPLQRPGQKPHGVLGTVSDITATKVMEKLLRESEGKLRAFIREAPVGIMITNEAHSCSFMNKTWGEISGMSAEDCLGTTWTQAVHEDDARELFLGRKRLSSLGHKVQMELRFVHPDDTIVWVTVKAVAMFDDAGARIGFLWTASDITERKKAEIERDRFFTISIDMLCVANLDGYFTRVNHSFTTALGWTAEELCERPLVDFVHPEDRLDTQEEFAKLANGYASVSFENRVKTKDGHWRWLAWNCPAPEDGNLYAVARDITEKRLAQEALKRLAHTDQLTGLRNRTTLMSQLSAKVLQAEQVGGKLAVLFIDLDEFKAINDEHGHDSGDVVIREVAGRLSSCVRRTDMVARLGGDEYVIVLDNATEKDAEQVSLKILAHVSEPLTLPNGHTVYPQASIGIANFPEDGNDPEDLVKKADKAMYGSKAAGGNRCG